MGHEFIELKNSNAAIEAYRRAAGEFAMMIWDFSLDLTSPRREPEGLPSLVWFGASIRTS